MATGASSAKLPYVTEQPLSSFLFTTKKKSGNRTHAGSFTFPERWTTQAYDQGALLSQLDLAVLLNTSSYTAGQYVREYQNLYHRPLPTRGNIQLIGSGQTHKHQIIALHLRGFLVPSICQRTRHSKEAVERYIRDFEAIKILSTKFDDVDTISRLVRLSPSVVKQYLDLIPLDS